MRLLACLIVAATVLFVVGVAVERGREHHEPAVAHEEAGGEGGAAEPAELRPLGVDVEAWPFVAAAASASLALAAAAWRRRPSAPLLWLIALAMAAFAALDVREVLHQLDLDETGLAVLAAAVAALHLAAALLAARIAIGGQPARLRATTSRYS
jgi:hypothetical protein